MLSREVGSVAHLSCRIKGNIIFTQEFSAIFSQQPLTLTVIGGKNYLFNIGLRKIFWLKRAHSSCSQREPQHRSEALLLGFPSSAASRALHCLEHQCLVLKDCGLQRVRGSSPSWIAWIYSCKCEDLQFVSSVLFCFCFGDSSEILIAGKGVSESQRKGFVLLPPYMSQKAGIFRGQFYVILRGCRGFEFSFLLGHRFELSSI